MCVAGAGGGKGVRRGDLKTEEHTQLALCRHRGDLPSSAEKGADGLTPRALTGTLIEGQGTGCFKGLVEDNASCL